MAVRDDDRELIVGMSLLGCGGLLFIGGLLTTCAGVVLGFIYGLLWMCKHFFGA